MGFPEVGPTLEQSRILREVTDVAMGRWPKSVIREFWGIVGFHRYKKPEYVQRVIKKYNIEKLDFHNPFLIKYIYNIFDEEIIPRLEYKYNYKCNENSDKLSVCRDCKSLVVYRQNLPSVIQCSEHNSMVYASPTSVGSNTRL